MDNIWFVAAIWMGLALVASLISIRVGLSVALIEIVVGVAAGPLDSAGRHRSFAGGEDDHQVGWRAATVADVLHAVAGGQLHHLAHVHRADLRHDFGVVRPHQ